MNGATIIRPSSLVSWGDCARRAAANLFRKEIEAAGYFLGRYVNSVAASVGTATHDGAALILEEKMLGRLGAGTITAAEQAGVESITKQAQSGIVWDGTSPNLNTAQRQVVRMTRCFNRYLVPQIDPIAVEERLEIDVGDGFVVSGQSDDVTNEPNLIRDTKTGVINRTHAAQLGAYSLIQRSHGRAISGAATDFVQRVSLNKDQPPPVTTKYALVDIEPVARHRIDKIKRELTEFRRRIVMGDQDPVWAFDNNPSSMLCSSRFCPAWGSEFCSEWRHKEAKNGTSETD